MGGPQRAGPPGAQGDKAAKEAGGDLDDVLTALADVEVLVRNARKALLDLPATTKES
jgi:hypothetical protein